MKSEKNKKFIWFDINVKVKGTNIQYQSSKLAMLLLYVHIIIFTSSSQSSRLQGSTTEILYNEADTDGYGGRNRNRIVVRPTYVIRLTPIHGIWGGEPDATLLHEVTCGRSVVF